MKKRQGYGTEGTNREKSLLYRLWGGATNRKPEEAEPEKAEGTVEVSEEAVPADGQGRGETGEEAVPIPQGEPADAGESGDEFESGEKEPESREKEHSASDMIRLKFGVKNYLEWLRRGEEARAPGGIYYSDFMADGEEPDEEKKQYLMELMEPARLLVERRQAFKEASAAAARREAGEEGGDGAVGDGEAPREPVESSSAAEDSACLDAQAYVQVSSDRMEAWLFIFPPEEGGKGPEAGQIRGLLESCHVSYGVDQALIDEVVEGGKYMKLAVIARGLLPVEGRDGQIVDHFSREQQIRLEEEERRTVNFRNLNWLQQVRKDEVICDIIDPTPGEDGVRVTGEPFRTRRGINALVPRGKNTRVNEEGTALLADIDGSLSFAHGVFGVESMMTINSDVDFSVGNMDIVGELVIKGDVLGGFVLKATGDIRIAGVVGSATIISGGSITVSMGVNGNGEGKLTAKGDIKCSYMESCSAQAGKSIYSNSIVNCNVVANEGVYVNGGQGCIIGGTVIAFKEICAKRIGNLQNRQTTITLGNTPEMILKKREYTDGLKKASREIANVNKDIAYLERKEAPTAAQQKQLQELKMCLSERKIEKLKCMRNLEQLGGENEFCPDCRLTANTIYPPVKISIGGSVLLVEEVRNMCVVTYSDGEVKMG